MGERRDATEHTRQAIEEATSGLPWDDRQDFEDAMRGFIAPLPPEASHIPGPLLPIWDDDAFGFITDDAPCPPTVNPRSATPTCRTSPSSRATPGSSSSTP
jgi:alkyl sulfatase BDS1-like metallo-beta-lactamase superfamily hydrolase